MSLFDKVNLYTISKGLVKTSFKISGLSSANADLKHAGVDVAHKAKVLSAHTWKVIESKLGVEDPKEDKE